MARILLVDDEEMIRHALRRALEKAGHDVIEAANGAEALRLNRHERVDVVVTDILMPEKDGVEIIVALRLESPDIKVIAMSGGGHSNQTQALDIAEPLGAFASLRKPFSVGLMLDVVAQAVVAGQQQRRAG
jgi:DNA-binding NtrC family response regulator